MTTDVIDLVDHGGAVAMALVRDLAEMRNDLVGPVQKIAADQHARLVRRRRLDDDHGGPASRSLAVVAEVPLAG